jgi:hypothetical protein
MSKKRTKYTSAFKTKLVLELLQNKICPFLEQSICIYLAILFYETQLDQLTLSDEADFIQGLLKKNGKNLAQYFNFTFRIYI